MEHADAALFLALNQNWRIGRNQLGRLIARYGSLDAVMASPQSCCRDAGLQSKSIIRLAGAAAKQTTLSQQAETWSQRLRHWQNDGIEPLFYTDPRYPALLRQIPDPPPLLFCRGRLSLLRRTTLAIVGSRKASPYGKRCAGYLADALSSAGLCISSGLARGIDAAAHQAAIKGSGETLAVLGCGVDTVYPASNSALQQQIAARGLLLSEYLPGTRPLAHHFPERNRVISGLSKAIIVIEAAPKSGSLITARLGLEQNRDVFAVPGHIDSDAHLGCHQLIQQGAKLVSSAADVLEEMGLQQDTAEGSSDKEVDRRSRPVSADSEISDAEASNNSLSVSSSAKLEPELGTVDVNLAKRLLRLLASAPARTDTLASELQLGIPALSAALLELEAAGLIAQELGRYQLALDESSGS